MKGRGGKERRQGEEKAGSASDERRKREWASY